jgi:hypothetical protein
MKAKVFFVALTFLVVCGCSDHVQFERTASQLRKGISKSEVRRLFAAFKLIDETNELSRINWATMWYTTNNEYASQLQFCSKLFPQWCTVYFDTNDIIVAQYYNPPGHQTAHATPPPK